MLTTKLNRILVPTDFSDTASHALRYASHLANRLGASLTVLYSDPFVPPIDYTSLIWAGTGSSDLPALAQEQLRHYAEMNIDRSVPYDTVVRIATPREGILAQARESGAGLIVMGTHGRTGFRRLVIGSVTEAIMQHADVPVITVPPHIAITSSIATIVCPVTYNRQCHDALTFAAGIAPPEALFILIRATSADAIIHSSDDLARLRAWVPPAIASRCELRMFGNHHIASQVESFAKVTQADLIVAAESDDRTATDVLHGTFAARLMQHSDCPVLTMSRPAALVASVVPRLEELAGVVQ